MMRMLFSLSHGAFIRWGFYPPGLLSAGAFIRWGFYPLGLLSVVLFSAGLLSVGLLSYTQIKAYEYTMKSLHYKFELFSFKI